MILLAAAMLLPLLVHAQVYVTDYEFSTSTTTFQSISGSGTELTSLQAYDATATVSLPFTFPFGSESCSVLTLTSDADIVVGPIGNVQDNYSLIEPLGINLDMDPISGGGHVYYQSTTYGGSEVMVLEYDHVRLATSTASSDYGSFQVWIYDNGNIDFVYDSFNVSGMGTAYCLLQEAGAGVSLSVVGSWNAPRVNRSGVASMSLTATDKPTSGLVYSFVRIDNNCPRPLNFIARSFSRPDSVVLAWNADPSATNWELRYDTVGVSVDSMLNIVTNLFDSAVVCSTLVAGQSYDFYVRTDCGSEQSFWAGPLTVTPGAYNMPATGVNSIYACGGTIYDDGGAVGNYSNSCNSTLTIYPSSPDSMVVISGSINTESCCDHLYVYDGAAAVGSPVYQGEGTVTFGPIRSTQGPLTLLFTSDGSVVNSGFAISVSCVAAPQCRYVDAVSASHVAGASAMISWTVAGPAAVPLPETYVIELINADDSTVAPVVYTATEMNYFLSGLTGSTNYIVNVNSICDGDTVIGQSLAFRTMCTSGGMYANIGNARATASGVPVYSSYGNSFCQQIFLASELSGLGLSAGPITGMTFDWVSNTMPKEITIFLTNTTQSQFTSTGNRVSIQQNMCVYGPQAHPVGTSGVTEYIFDTPFVWDGTSNICVTTFVNQPTGSSHSSSGFYAYATQASTTQYRSLYAYRDASAYTVAAVSNLTANARSYYRSNVGFKTPCDSVYSCVAPNVVVTANEADHVDIIWAPGYDETAWDIKYREAGDSVWVNEAAAVTSTSYTFTTFNPMTDYEIRLYPTCGGDSIYSTTLLTTPCVPIMTLPFQENFENGFVAASTMGSPITNCWTRFTNYTSSSYPYLSSSYANSGSHSMYFYATSSYYSGLALPALDAAIDSLQVTFAAYKTSAVNTYVVNVGVMTDPSDYSTFTPIASVTPSAASSWEMFEIPLNGYVGNGKYIAFVASGGTSYIYIDDIEVNYIPTCPRPTNVAVSGVTTSSATVSWMDTTSTYFEVEYGPHGFAPGTGDMAVSTLDSVVLTNLRHSSRYDVYVRALCSSIDTSYWSFVQSFTTDCGSIDTLPFTENFASWGVSSTARPACWNMGGYGSYPYIVNVIGANGAISGQALYMYCYNSTSTANKVYASMPALDSVTYPVHLTQATFTAWTSSTSSSHDLIVGVCSVPGDMANFTAVDTITLTAEPAEYEVAFDACQGAGKYVTFVSTYTAGTSQSNYAYIGQVTLDLIPSCQRPNMLVASNVRSNAVDLSWHERSGAAAWQIEYGPRGFVRGQGTRAVVTSNPYTLNGLTPGTDYDYYVRSICNASDTSEWVSTPCMFNTIQIPATVPYSYDFEDLTEWNNWQVNSNTTIGWYRGSAAGNGAVSGTGTYAMYVSADSGATYGTDMEAVVNAAVYRDIDFGTIDSSYTLSFRAKAGGTSSAGYDALMVFVVDPATPVVASNSNITSPWGSVVDMTPLATVRLSTNWNTYTATIDTLTGVHRLVFFWFNQNTGADYPYIGGPGAVDDISINYQGCPRPAGIVASNVSTSSADISWHGPAQSTYLVSYRPTVMGTLRTDTTLTNSYHLSGLNSGTSYTVQVRRICSDTETSETSVAMTFVTDICGGSHTDSICSSSASVSTSYNVPVNNFYKYSYTQQIVLASELSAAGEIAAIDFNFAGAAATVSKTNCTIYMGHTSLASFATTTDAVSRDSLQVVYTGNMNCTPGWNRFVFSTPFEYDGQSNLVIAIDDNSNRYDGSQYTFYTENCANAMTLNFYSDTQNPNPSQLSSFTGSKSVQTYRNQMVLAVCPPNACPTPRITRVNLRGERAQISWTGTYGVFELSYRRAASTVWSDPVTVNDTVYTINNLYPQTEYVFRVRQLCDTVGTSHWATGEFNTADQPCLAPANLRVTTLTNNTASFVWTPDENNIRYRLHVFNTMYDNTVDAFLSQASVSGLSADFTYYAAVAAYCSEIEGMSEWSDTIEFTTAVCPDASNLTVSNIQGNSCVLDWVPGGDETSWEIQFGEVGFLQGEGQSVIADTHPFTLTSLTGETYYSVYVRAICGHNFYSEHWSNGVNFETEYSAITSVTDDSRIAVQPNPATSSTTISVTGVSGKVRIDVVDVNGRTVASETMECSSDCEKTMDVNNLTQGAYFVRVTGEGFSTVKKLVVR